MIRNLKVLIAAAMALAAFGAISASGAQAAEFHCEAAPCTINVLPDGTPEQPKTKHQVFIVKQGVNSVSTTCNTITGHGTSEVATFSTLTLTDIVYHGCNVAGEPSTVKMNKCEYDFTAGGIHDATPSVKCPAGKVIEIEVTKTGCLITIGSTEHLPGGLTFHDPETNKIQKDLVTAEVTVTNIPTTVVNNKCPAPLKEGVATGEYTTGNVELTAQVEPSGAMTKFWWA
jgi:hypothetical protein